MWELYIVRHGIAVERGTPGIPDDERPLTPRGEKRMKEIGDGLAALELPVDRIVTSPLPRAHRTAEILAERLRMAGDVEIAPVLSAESTARDIAQWLGLQPEAPLLIVGHNPGLEELLGLLLLGDPKAFPFTLKKGGIVALRRPASEPERYTIEWAATPRVLRRLSN
ncbi:phosphohistidine phosphatase SixA [Paludisphaera rhizosphaerae]|uniref:phosphohistidine phosphatase SixA n=1 Tax=Paludisphaera rhizosphaerae TaxID=2711216 RepID=UPI0013EC3673|nr:phosphohistidine phosphatase SixA [Paludisphaera rhizosphaerae]